MMLSSIAALLLTISSHNNRVLCFQSSSNFAIKHISTAASLRSSKSTTQSYITPLYAATSDDSSSTTTNSESKLDEITRQLEDAKARFNESRNNVVTLQKEEESTLLETENIIDKLKSSFV